MLPVPYSPRKARFRSPSRARCARAHGADPGSGHPSRLRSLSPLPVPRPSWGSKPRPPWPKRRLAAVGSPAMPGAAPCPGGWLAAPFTPLGRSLFPQLAPARRWSLPHLPGACAEREACFQARQRRPCLQQTWGSAPRDLASPAGLPPAPARRGAGSLAAGSIGNGD